MTRIRLLTMIALLLGFAPPAAGVCEFVPLGGTVGLFAEPEAKSTTIVFDTIPSVRTIYIVAFLAGVTSDGFTGAQFRVEVEHPAAWPFFTWEFPTASLVLGDPLDLEPDDPDNESGVVLAWPQCQTGGPDGPGTPIVIGTITTIALPGAQSSELRVKRRWPPTSPNAPCARFSRCDAEFSRARMPVVDVDAFGEEIVSRSYLLVEPTVQLEAQTWSRLKQLYD